MINGRFSPGMLAEIMETNETNPSDLDELEVLAEQLTNKIGRQMLKRWLQECEEADPAPNTRCCFCGEVANLISKRPGFMHTKFGLVRYLRAYYVCPQCHHSTCPLDERVNPYESLARLRRQITTGKSLPVDELANSWGLGSLNGTSQDNSNSGQKQMLRIEQINSRSNRTFPIHSSDGLICNAQDQLLAAG